MQISLVARLAIGTMFSRILPISAALVMTLFLSGCNLFDSMSMRGDPVLELPVQDIIPADWTTLGTLNNINIDGDTEVERLVFFNYDNNPNNAAIKGPVGALVYDIQSDADWVTGSDKPREYYPIPNQPSGFYVPYRILPNYWEPAIGRTDFTSAHGRASFPHFIGPPDALMADLIIEPVSRFVPPDLDLTGLSDAESQEPEQELIIRGGETHITVIWWKNVFDGYGVVQLHAPYGFSQEDGGGGVIGTNPIQSIVGSFPVNDRSRFCRKVRYDRQLVDDIAAHDPSPLAIRYRTAEMGLYFCDAIPAHPFYPEGVVLAYLLDPVGHGNLVYSPFENDFNTEVLREKLSQYAQLDDTVRVENIFTRVGLPHLNHQRTQGPNNLGRVQGGDTLAWQTNVCVEIMNQDDDPNAGSKQQLRFRLHHEPPSLALQQTDRWYIMDLIPQVDIRDNLDCQTFIQALPPEN